MLWRVISISFHFNLRSHPDKYLIVHLKNVGNLSKSFVEEKWIAQKEFYSKIAYLIGITHDFGKASEYFQSKLRGGEKSEKARHSLISAVWSYFVVKKFLDKYPENNSELYPLIAYLVVSRHHSDLRNLMGPDGEKENLKNKSTILKQQLKSIMHNKEELESIYNELCSDEYVGICDLNYFLKHFDDIQREIIRDLRKLATKVKCNADFFLLLLFFYSILLDADKMDASNSPYLERKSIRPKLVDEYRSFKFSTPKNEMNRTREEIYKEVIKFSESFDPLNENHRLMCIELPTGSGKTLSAFSLSLKLRKKIEKEIGVIPRIIYSLPFLSIIDQNSSVIGEVLLKEVGVEWKKIWDTDELRREIEDKIPSNLMLVHHHLADIFYETEEDEFDISKSKILTEGWNSEVIITTFIQVFHSLITNRNSAVRKFHKMINSIIILDEVQNIPIKYWNLIREFFITLSKKFNTWIILMTATMPLIFEEGDYTNIIGNPEKYYSCFNRNIYEYLDTPLEIEDFRNNILEEITESHDDILVILNRVSAVKWVYKSIRELAFEGGKVDEKGIYVDERNKLKIINLTTHIVPAHRFERIREIRLNDEYRKIVISTQLVEAGVDISAKKVYRDIAPLDSIFQAGGRGNRGNEYGILGGKVNICEVIGDRGALWKKVYDPTLIDITNNVLKKYGVFEEKSSKDIIDKFYKKVKEKGASDENIIKNIKRCRFWDVKDFKLIDEKYPKSDVFVEINDEATKVLEEYRSILKIKDPILRKNRFLQIKKRFYNFVVSVPDDLVSKLTLVPIAGDMYLIPKDEIDEKYDLETGIISHDTSLIF